MVTRRTNSFDPCTPVRLACSTPGPPYTLDPSRATHDAVSSRSAYTPHLLRTSASLTSPATTSDPCDRHHTLNLLNKTII